MKRTSTSANPKKTSRKSKGTKRDREDDDSQDDLSDTLVKRVAPPIGSIQAVFLGEPPIQPHLYQEWFSAGYFNFSLLHWDVIQNNILVYLNYADTIALARTTRQWYRRIANVACSKFEVFLWSEFDTSNAQGRAELVARYPDSHNYCRHKVGSMRKAFQNLTPLAISYYSGIGKVIWDRRCKIRTCLTAKSKKWNLRKIMDDTFSMLEKIEKHGNIDSYKAHTLVNNQRLDELFKLEADRVQRVFRLLRNILGDLGYKSNFEVRIIYDSCQIRIKPNWHVREWGSESADDPKLRLNAVYNALRYGNESDLRALDIKAILYLLVSDKLVAKI